MPTYDYACEKCGHAFERFQSITAGALRKCPQCDQTALKRLIGTGAGIIFKGSGFYQTDYRSDSYKNAQKNEKSSSATSDKKKTETKSEVKETKPNAKPKTAAPAKKT